MDWAVNTTGLIITSGTCSGQKAQSVNNTSGGRSGTQSCWWMVDQICADPVWPPSPECVVLQTLLQLTQCGITPSELETLAMDRSVWCSAVHLLAADCVITRQLINCFCCSVAPLHCLHCLLASRSQWLLSSPLSTTMFCHNAVTNRLNCLILTGTCLTVFNYV